MSDVGDRSGCHLAPAGRDAAYRRRDERACDLPRRCGDPGARAPAEDEVIEIEPGALSGIFAAPQWLRDLGFSSWLLVGVGAALVGAIWLLSLTETIVMPVITAGIIASVASPLVDWLRRHGIPRGIGAGAGLPRDRR